MASAIRSIELPDVTLPYVEQGDESGVPVLLLHGFAGSWRSFDPLLPHLPTSLHVLALTQRGHGDASHPATGYRLHDFSADVAAFMEALQLEEVVLVGHSMGSAVAQRFAIEHPDATIGLVLVGAGVPTKGDPAVQAFWDSTVSNLTDPIDPTFVRGFLESTLAQPVPEPLFERLVQDSLKVPARVWKGAFKGRLKEDLSGELGTIKAPTLIVWGDQDARCPRSDQDTLATEIPHSRLVVYKGAGHGLHYEEPVRFASDLVAFVTDLDS